MPQVHWKVGDVEVRQTTECRRQCVSFERCAGDIAATPSAKHKLVRCISAQERGLGSSALTLHSVPANAVAPAEGMNEVPRS